MNTVNELREVRIKMLGLAGAILDGVDSEKIDRASRQINAELKYWESKIGFQSSAPRRQFIVKITAVGACAPNGWGFESPWLTYLGTFNGALVMAKRFVADKLRPYKKGDGPVIFVKDMQTRKEFKFKL